MSKELWMYRKALGIVLRRFGVRDIPPLLFRPVVSVRYDDILKIATWLVARQYGIRSIKQWRGSEPVLTPYMVVKITEGQIPPFWCHYHKIRSMTPSELIRCPLLSLVSEKKRLILLTAITKFQMEVLDLAEGIWEALGLVAVEPPKPGDMGKDDGVGGDDVQVRGGGDSDDGGSGLDAGATEEGEEGYGSGEGDYPPDAEYLGEFAAGGSH